MGICGAVRLIRLPTERQVMTTIYSQYGSTDITNFAPQHNHIPQHTFSRSVPDTTGAQPPRLTVIHHNANVRLVLHGKYLELKIQPKISSDPFPHSPPRIIRHPSPPHQFAISSVPIRSWPSDRSLVDIRQS